MAPALYHSPGISSIVIDEAETAIWRTPANAQGGQALKGRLLRDCRRTRIEFVLVRASDSDGKENSFCIRPTRG